MSQTTRTGFGIEDQKRTYSTSELRVTAELKRCKSTCKTLEEIKRIMDDFLRNKKAGNHITLDSLYRLEWDVNLTETSLLLLHLNAKGQQDYLVAIVRIHPSTGA